MSLQLTRTASIVVQTHSYRHVGALNIRGRLVSGLPASSHLGAAFWGIKRRPWDLLDDVALCLPVTCETSSVVLLGGAIEAIGTDVPSLRHMLHGRHRVPSRDEAGLRRLRSGCRFKRGFLQLHDGWRRRASSRRTTLLQFLREPAPCLGSPCGGHLEGLTLSRNRLKPVPTLWGKRQTS